jgi:hypothetical protein
MTETQPDPTPHRPRPPSPETKRALLPSVAFEYPTWTRHKFVEARPCVLPGACGGPAYEFIFQCCETGFERRWGVVERTVRIPEVDDPVDFEGGN